MAVPRILIVDDEQDIATAMGLYLEGALEVEVAAVRNGREALERLAAEPDIALVLSDYRMPGMSGLEFLRQAERLRPQVPKVLLTAYPDTALAIAALNQGGVARFLTKPVEPDALAEVVVALTAASRRKLPA